MMAIDVSVKFLMIVIISKASKHNGDPRRDVRESEQLK